MIRVIIVILMSESKYYHFWNMLIVYKDLILYCDGQTMQNIKNSITKES